MTQRPPPSRDDLLSFLADPEAMPDAAREALEAALDDAVAGAVQALPPAEPSAGFDRALFDRLDALDQATRASAWGRLRAWWTAPLGGPRGDALDPRGARPAVGRTQGRSSRRGLDLRRGHLALALAGAGVVLLVALRASWPAPPVAPALLAQAEALELALDLELYENLEVVEVLDVLDDLEVIEGLEDEG